MEKEVRKKGRKLSEKYRGKGKKKEKQENEGKEVK